MPQASVFLTLRFRFRERSQPVFEDAAGKLHGACRRKRLTSVLRNRPATSRGDPIERRLGHEIAAKRLERVFGLDASERNRRHASDTGIFARVHHAWNIIEPLLELFYQPLVCLTLED